MVTTVPVEDALGRGRTAIRDRVRGSHLARNSTLIMASTVVNGVLGVVYWMLLGNGYSTDTIGVASALLQAITLASLVATLGLGQTLIQRLPHADDATWSMSVNGVVFGGFLSGATAGVLSLLMLPHVSHRFDVILHPAFAVLVVLGTAALTVANLFDYVFIGQRAAHYVLVRAGVFGLLKLAIVAVPLLFLDFGVAAVVGSWVLAAAGTSLITSKWLLPGLGRQHRWSPRGVAADLRSLAPQMMRNHLISLSATALPTLMPTLVVARSSAEANAYFYMAWLVSSILLTVSAAVSGSLLAEGTYDPGLLGKQVRHAALLIGGLLVVPTVVLSLAGRPIMHLFGAQYAAHSYLLVLVFMIAIIPDAVTNIYVTVCRVRRQTGVAAAVNITGSGVALVAAWFLIPVHGAIGAVWGWILGQSAGAVVVASHLAYQRLRQPGSVVSGATS
jgi:O-antigen/teichoic acid export membrane protein